MPSAVIENTPATPFHRIPKAWIGSDLASLDPTAGHVREAARGLHGRFEPGDVETKTFRFTDNVAYPIASEEQAFLSQKRLFETIDLQYLESYRGRYVASVNGRVVDADPDLATLARRFVASHGDVPVYMTRVGNDRSIQAISPVDLAS